MNIENYNNNFKLAGTPSASGLNRRNIKQYKDEDYYSIQGYTTDGYPIGQPIDPNNPTTRTWGAWIGAWVVHILFLIAILVLTIIILVCVARIKNRGPCCPEEPCDPRAPWAYHGLDCDNTKHRTCDPITAENAHELGLHCYLEVGHDVSAIPSVSAEGVAYFPTWGNNDNDTFEGGYLYAVYVDTCQVKWRHPIENYTGIEEDVARVTPAISECGNWLVLGSGQGDAGRGAYVFRVNAHTGEGDWITKMDNHTSAIITAAPVIKNGLVFGGVASREEADAAFIPDYECCSFIGSAYSLDFKTGEILWQTYTSVNQSGNAIWGSGGVFDFDEFKVCWATGNNYAEDEFINDCLANLTEGEDTSGCLMEGNEVNAIICYDMYTGNKIWSNRVTGPDAWNVACVFNVLNPENCPEEFGPDYDFGQAPMKWWVRDPETKEEYQVVGSGQKSGIFWALRYDNGEVVWANQVAPGSSLGGFEWGSAVGPDGIFAANANRDYLDYTLLDGRTTCSGSWVKLDKDTGRVLWQTPDPFAVFGEENCTALREEVFPPPDVKRLADKKKNKHVTRNAPGHADGPLAYALGPVTLVNDVMFAGSFTGFLYAFDQETGEIIWEYDTGGSYNTAPAIWNGHVISGSGYRRFDLGPGTDKFFVWKLGGHTEIEEEDHHDD